MDSVGVKQAKNWTAVSNAFLLLGGGKSLGRITLGARPAGKHKGNLVHKVRNVVANVEHGVVHSPEQVAKQVAKWVDRPTHCDDQAHVVEGFSNRCTAANSSASSLTTKDLIQNVEPAVQATYKGRRRRKGFDFTTVSECKHHDGAKQKPPEHPLARGLAGRFKDQVELNHLERYCDAPVHIAVDDGGCVNLHPVLTHVHVVHSCHQSHQSTHMQKCSPVGKHSP